MKLANNVVVNVFCKQEDNEDEIKKALMRLFPFDFGKEKIAIDEQNATGFNERKVKILEARLKKNRHINSFLKHLKKCLGEQSKKLAEEAESRIDNELHFFIRLDKEKMFKENEYLLTGSGNCFHIKVSLAVYPKKREKAIGLARDFFGTS